MKSIINNTSLSDTVNGKPSLAQLSMWCEKGLIVSFAEERLALFFTKEGDEEYKKIEKVHHGKIKAIDLRDPNNVGLLIENSENSKSYVYRNNIVNYRFTLPPKPEPMESLFLNPNSNSLHKVTLTAEDQTGKCFYYVDGEKLAKRVGADLKLILENRLKESSESERVIDLNQLSPQQLDALLSAANVGHCKFFTLEQAQDLREAAVKLFDRKMIKQADERINELLELATLQFIEEVAKKNHTKCEKLLLSIKNVEPYPKEKKAGIINQLKNRLFYNGHSPKMSELFYERPLNYNTRITPLTHAVEEGDEKLVELLLKHGANPNVFAQNHHPPLITAALKHNVEIVKLLLDAGAEIYPLFSTAKSWLRHWEHSFFISSGASTPEDQERACENLFNSLMRVGASCNPNPVLGVLRNPKHTLSTLNDPDHNPNYKRSMQLFTKIWKKHCELDWKKHCELERFYTRGALGGALDQASGPKKEISHKKDKTLPQLPLEIHQNIASFLSWNAGASLAATCKQAARTASKAREEGKNRINQKERMEQKMTFN